MRINPRTLEDDEGGIDPTLLAHSAMGPQAAPMMAPPPMPAPPPQQQAPVQMPPPAAAPGAMPSGLMTPAQREDMNARLMAINVGQAASEGSMAAANIYSKGAAGAFNPGVFDSMRAQLRAPQEDAERARKQALEQHHLAQQDEKFGWDREAQIEATKQKRLQAQQLQDSLDPKSEFSKSQVDQAKMLYGARAQVLQDQMPQIAGIFQQAAKGLDGKNAMDVMKQEDRLKELMGDTLKYVDIKAKQDLAAGEQNLKQRGVTAQERLADSTIGDRRSDNQLQREKFEFEKGKEHEKANKVHMTEAQKKEVDEMGKLLTFMDKSEDWLGDLKSGKIKTGLIAGNKNSLINSLDSVIPQSVQDAIPGTKPDEALNTFNAQKDPLYAEMERTMSGSSKWNKEQKERFHGSLLNTDKDSPEYLQQKLNATRDMIKTRLHMLTLGLQRGDDGEPIDKSIIAQMASEQSPNAAKRLKQIVGEDYAAPSPLAVDTQQRIAAGAPPAAAPTKSPAAASQPAQPPPSVPPDKVQRARKALLDPHAPPAAKAAAQRILNAVGQAVQNAQ